MCETFYKCLYSSNNGNESECTNDVFFGSQTEKRLNLTEQDSCEGLLTKTECLNALKNMDLRLWWFTSWILQSLLEQHCRYLSKIHKPRISYRIAISDSKTRHHQIKLIPKSKETYGQTRGINSSQKQFTCFYKMFSVSNTFLGLTLWNW